MTRSTRIHGNGKHTTYLKNHLSGVLGVAASFTTAPTNLVKCTNGIWSDSTGTGSKNVNGLVGTITFDLGSSKTVIVGGKLGLWTSAATVIAYVHSSEDNITYTDVNPIAISTGSLSKVIREMSTKMMKGRYIRLYIETSGLATGNVTIYEIEAWGFN